MFNSKTVIFPFSRVISGNSFRLVILVAMVVFLTLGNVAKADLKLYSTFDNSSLNDTSGNGYTGKYVGSGTFSTPTGKVGSACKGNGSSKYNISISSAGVTLQNMTVSLWVKNDGTNGNWKDYMSLWASNFFPAGEKTYTGKTIHFQRANYNTDSMAVYANGDYGAASLGGWSVISDFSHVVLTVDNGTAKLYINGVLQSTQNWTNTSPVTDITLCGTWWGWEDGGDRSCTHTIDEVQIYNTGLSAEQVTYLKNNPSLYIATEYSRNVSGDGNWSDSVWSANGKENQAFGQSSAVKLIANPSGTLTLDQNITVNSIDATHGTGYESGNVTISGSNTITLNGQKYIGVEADTLLTIATPIATAFTKKGDGTLEITNANSAYSGTTTISEGVLKLSGSGKLGSGGIANNATLELAIDATLSNVISGSGNVIKSGTGTTTISLANSYAGGTTISNGTLKLTGNGTLGSGSIAVQDGATLLVDTDRLQTTASLSGVGTIEFSKTSAFKTVGTQSDFTGKIVVDNGASLQIRGWDGSTESIATDDFPNASLELKGNSNLVLMRGSGWYSSLTIKDIQASNSSSVIRSNSNGSTENGVVNIGSGSVASNIGVNGVAENNRISIVKTSDGSEDGGTLTLSGNHYYTGGTTVNAGTLEITGNATLGTGSIAIKDSATLLVNTDRLQRTTAISGAGTIEFAKTSAFKTTGTQSDFTGKIVVDDGASLQIRGWDGTTESIATDNLPNATLELNGSSNLVLMRGSGWHSSLTIKELQSADSNSVIRANVSGSSENGVVNIGSGSFAGNIGTTTTAEHCRISLVKTSDGSEDGGTLTLSGNNYSTGGTTINAGTLKLTGNATLGTGPVTINENGTLEYDVEIAKNITNTISGSGTVLVTGSGTLDMSQDVTAKQLNVDASTLQMADGKTLTGSMTIGENGKLEIGSNTTPATANITSNLTIDTDGKLNFDFSTDKHDVLNVGEEFNLADKAITLSFNEGNESDWFDGLTGDGYQLIAMTDNTLTGNLSRYLDTTGLTQDWGLTGLPTGLYLTAAPSQTGVPEPSTWALLILGFAGLMWYRKRK